jgi:acyl transferase domain-containing protein
MRALAYTFSRQFLEHVNPAEIDLSLWPMTRKEIEVKDPQQHLTLKVVYECLQKSGTTDWKGKDIGVFFRTHGEVLAY